MKCQAQVERITGHSNVAGFRRGARMVHSEYNGTCTRNAVAKLGALSMCAAHVKLALEGLIDESGKVADRGSLRDVRRYPNKFRGGLYSWAKDLKPEPLPLTPPPVLAEPEPLPSLKTRKEIAGDIRAKAAIEHLNAARDLLNAACRDLCSVGGAAPYYRDIAKLADSAHNIAKEINLDHARKHRPFALQHEPSDREINEPHFACGAPRPE